MSDPRAMPSGTVTFMFTDVEGSTKLLRELGERYPRVLATQRRIIAAAAEAEAGIVVDTEGDGTFLAFPNPTGGIQAALAAQLELARTDWEGATVRVRMGLHTGEAEVLEGTGYIGLAVHEAARIASSGHGGQVVVSDVTARLVEGRLPPAAGLVDLGEHLLKDFPAPLRIHQLSHPQLADRFPPLKATSRRAYNVPAQLTSFIGREDQIAEVEAALAAHRLVTLTGSIGCGKTRLAYEVASKVAERFSSGVWVVELSKVADDAGVATAACQALGVAEVAGRSALDLLTDHLGDREALLVLDKCEHVIGGAAELAERVLRTCPRARVLATGREVLETPGEVARAVPAMHLPRPGPLPPLDELIGYEAIRLFVERAQAVEPAFRLTDSDAAHVVQVCRRLDGLPMAIELAAARVKALDIAGIASRLDDRFRLLTSGSGRDVGRQQTLRAAFDWSHDLLTEAERVLFRRLAAFAGGFSVAAVEAVGAFDQVPKREVADLLARLVSRSLVVKEWTAAGIRFHMLETIRSYALERLQESAEQSVVRRRHLRWFERVAEETWESSRQRRPSRWADRVEADLDNVRLAMEWALESREGEAALTILRGVGPHWFDRGRLQELRAMLQHSLALDPDVRADLRAAAHALSALVHHALGDLDGAAAAADTAFEVARGAGDDRSAGMAVTVRALVAGSRGNRRSSRDHHQEAFALHRAAGNESMVASTLRWLAELDLADGDQDAARPKLEQALAMHRAAEEDARVAETLVVLASAARGLGDVAGAKAMQQEALELARDLGNRGTMAECCLALGGLAVAVGALDEAESWAEEALAIGEETGQRVLSQRAWVLRALIGIDRGEGAEATRALGRAADEAKGLGEWLEDELAVWRAFLAARSGAPSLDPDMEQIATRLAGRGDRAMAGLVHHALGRVALAGGRLDVARGHLLTSRDHLGADRRDLALALLSLGYLQLAEGEADLAVGTSRRAVAESARVGDHRRLSDALDAVAVALTAAGDTGVATRLFAAAAAIRDEIRVMMLPGDAERIRPALDRCRDELGDGFEREWNQGLSLTVDEALVLARG